MTEFPAYAALEAQVDLQAPIISQDKAVAGIDTVMLYMLMEFLHFIAVQVGLRDDLTYGVCLADLPGELSGSAVTAAVGDLLEIVIEDEVQMGITPFAMKAQRCIGIRLVEGSAEHPSIDLILIVDACL